MRDRLHAIELDCNHIPDAAMTLAVLALFADGTTTLTNIASWRVKETDRIAAMANELRKLGATVEEGADFIRVTPSHAAPLDSDVAIDTYDDHRMAMCFSLVALACRCASMIPTASHKTFPDYFERIRVDNELVPVPVIAIDGLPPPAKAPWRSGSPLRLGFHYLDSGALPADRAGRDAAWHRLDDEAGAGRSGRRRCRRASRMDASG